METKKTPNDPASFLLELQENALKARNRIEELTKEIDSIENNFTILGKQTLFFDDSLCVRSFNYLNTIAGPRPHYNYIIRGIEIYAFNCVHTILAPKKSKTCVVHISMKIILDFNKDDNIGIFKNEKPESFSAPYNSFIFTSPKDEISYGLIAHENDNTRICIPDATEFETFLSLVKKGFETIGRVQDYNCMVDFSLSNPEIMKIALESLK